MTISTHKKITFRQTLITVVLAILLCLTCFKVSAQQSIRSMPIPEKPIASIDAKGNWTIRDSMKTIIFLYNKLEKEMVYNDINLRHDCPPCASAKPYLTAGPDYAYPPRPRVIHDTFIKLVPDVIYKWRTRYREKQQPVWLWCLVWGNLIFSILFLISTIKSTIMKFKAIKK